jgi:hypothetical protein
MVLLLGLRVHETMIQKICKLIKDILLALLSVLWTWWSRLLVEAEHGEGIETEEHLMCRLR